MRLPKGRYGAEQPPSGRRTTTPCVTRRPCWPQPELIVDRDRAAHHRRPAGPPVRLTCRTATPPAVLIDLDGNFFGADGRLRLRHVQRQLRRAAQRPARSGRRRRSGSSPPSPASGRTPRRRAARTSTRSPRRYPGGCRPGSSRDYRRRDLATVVQRFAAPGGGLVAERSVFADVGYNTGGSASILPTAVPGQRVEYYNTDGVRWDSVHRLRHAGAGPALAGRAGRAAAVRARVPGRPAVPRPVERRAAEPSFPRPRWGTARSTRTGDVISRTVPLHSDAAGHPGGSLTDTARTALYRDGMLVGESADRRVRRVRGAGRCRPATGWRPRRPGASPT